VTRGDSDRFLLLRVVLAGIVVVDLVSFFFFVRSARPIGMANGALDAFTALVSAPAVCALVVLVGVAGAVAFARAPGRLAQGAVAFAALAVLSTVHARLFGSPWRHLYYSGLCLSGWLLGLEVTRRRGTPTDESYAFTGSVALLSAAYLNAGISKMVFGGAGWLSGLPIQEVIVGQDGLVADGLLAAYRVWAVTPAVSCLFSVATVVFELAAPLMLVGRRTRATVALGLFTMHANIYVLTDILYWESMVFLLVFGLWPDEPTTEVAAAPAIALPSDGRSYVVTGGVLALCALVAIGRQGRRFDAARGVATGPSSASASPTSAAPLSRIGPFGVGESLGDGWTIESVDTGENSVLVTLSGAPGRAVFQLTCAASEHRSPFDLGTAHVFYSSDVQFRDLENVGRAVSAKAREGARGTDVCTSIEGWRSSARAQVLR
jgi:hypothetical protein